MFDLAAAQEAARAKKESKVPKQKPQPLAH